MSCFPPPLAFLQGQQEWKENLLTGERTESCSQIARFMSVGHVHLVYPEATVPSAEPNK